ncbi:Outer membrane efflux protein [Candidatus Magnetomorum sp. HK-1]|nr:Outer membrane efflux protein [Candidatus Magnetomorum sp. HK-1]
MKFIQIGLMLLFFLVTTFYAWADNHKKSVHPYPANSKLSSVEDLISIAQKNNPDILSARQALKAVSNQATIMGSYPDPKFMVTFFPNPIETRLGPQDYNASISQVIPFPKKLSLKKSLALSDAEIAQLNLEMTIRKISLSIRESAYELQYVRTARLIAKQNIELLDHLRKIAETAHAEQRTAFVDVVKGQSQLAQVQYDLMLLDDLEKNEIARINAYLNRPSDFKIHTLEEMANHPLEYSLNALYKMAEVKQEKIRMASIRIEKSKINKSLAKYSFFPDFKLGVFYASIGSPDNPMTDRAGEDAYGIQLGMNIPLGFARNKAQIDQAQAQSNRMESEKKAQVNNLHVQIRNTYFRLQNAFRLKTLYQKQLLPQALHAMKIAEVWFQEGESSFSDFIEAQGVWYNFNLSLARAKADYGKYYSRLQKLTGIKSSKNKIQSNDKSPQYNQSFSLENMHLPKEKNGELDFSKYTQSTLSSLSSFKKYQSVAKSLTRTMSEIAKKLSLKELESLAILRNPVITAAKKRFHAEIESYSQVRYLDDILKQYAAYTSGLMIGVGQPMRGKNNVKKSFPFPGISALKGQIVNQNIDIAKEKLSIALRDTLAEARTIFFELLYIHKSKSITQKTVRLLTRLENQANTRYKTGKTSFQDVIKVRIRKKLLAENLRTLDEKQKNMEYSIREILNLSHLTPIGLPDHEHTKRSVPDINIIIEKAMKTRQELKIIKLRINKMETMIEMAETKIYPSFSNDYSLFSNDAINSVGSAAMKPGFSTQLSIFMGAGLPKNAWFGSNDAYLRQSRQKLLAIKSDLEKARVKTSTLIRNAWFSLDRDIREARLYKNEIISLARSALDASNRGYETSKVSFADVIGSYMNWLDVNLLMERKLSNIGISRANLIKIIGGNTYVF